MPIKPENKDRYPDNWESEIRPKVLNRADHCCEICGVRNHAIIRRSKKNGAIYFYIDTSDPNVIYSKLELKMWKAPIQIVLTIAHLDHMPENNEMKNLKAMCQRDHLKYDKEDNKQKREQTQAEKLEAVGQGKLFEGENNE